MRGDQHMAKARRSVPVREISAGPGQVPTAGGRVKERGGGGRAVEDRRPCKLQRDGGGEGITNPYPEPVSQHV